MRLIDAEALKKDILKLIGFPFGIPSIEAIINNAPTIEAKPIVHAHWEFMGYDDHGDSIYACTNCNYNVAATADHRPSKNIKYCPFCGAQMDEEVSK